MSKSRRRRRPRKTNAEHLLDLAARLPWWLNLLLALGCYLFFGQLTEGLPTDIVVEGRVQVRALVHEVSFEALFRVCQYVLPPIFCMGAVASLLRKSRSAKAGVANRR